MLDCCCGRSNLVSAIYPCDNIYWRIFSNKQFFMCRHQMLRKLIINYSFSLDANAPFVRKLFVITCAAHIWKFLLSRHEKFSAFPRTPEKKTRDCDVMTSQPIDSCSYSLYQKPHGQTRQAPAQTVKHLTKWFRFISQMPQSWESFPGSPSSLRRKYVRVASLST